MSTDPNSRACGQIVAIGIGVIPSMDALPKARSKFPIWPSNGDRAEGGAGEAGNRVLLRSDRIGVVRLLVHTRSSFHHR